MMRSVNERPARFHRAPQHTFQLYEFFAQCDLAASNPRHFHQIIHQANHMLHLSLHHLDHAAIESTGGLNPENMQGILNRGERVAEFVSEDREELVFAAARLAQRVFGPLSVCDVAGEATRMDEAAVLPQNTGVDEDVADRAVFTSQLCGAIRKSLSAGKASEDVFYELLIRVEVRNVAPDILLL